MDLARAKKIVRNAVAKTEPRWRAYDRSWDDIDTLFIKHGYEQQGFRCGLFAPYLSERGILSIKAIGGVLEDRWAGKPYDRKYAGGLTSSFYRRLARGAAGREAELFVDAVARFVAQEPGHCGRIYWRLLWHMLRACSYLRRHHGASFKRYLLNAYRDYATPEGQLTETEFLGISQAAWQEFCKATEPWKPLLGIGPNTFDYIIGDVVEARFVRDSYKFDSANQHFLKATGISKLIKPFRRETAVHFLPRLKLPYSLREINKGIYTYCSRTEAQRYGYCRSADKCDRCAVRTICEKRFRRC